MTISIDPEFKSLIPPLTDEEFSRLEASILEEGRARVPLDVWNGILIDGHNRFTICQRHNLPFTTQEVGTPDWTRTDAKIWLRHSQLHRRTLDSLTRCEVALGLEEDLRKNGLENKREAGKKRTAEAIRGDAGQLLQISAKASNAADEPPMTAPASKRVINPVNTRKEISKAAGVSHDTLDKAKVILAKAPEAVKEAIRSGKTTINREYKEIMKEQKQRELEKMHEAIIKSLPDRAERYHIIHCGITDIPIEDESVDCIITTPPYSVYSISVFTDLGITASRVLKPGGSCFVMVDQSILIDAGVDLSTYLTYQWNMLYMTSDGQATRGEQRKIGTIFKPILWFVKGKYNGKRIDVDVVPSKPNRKNKWFPHWSQSENSMADLIERVSEPGDVILDPFLENETISIVAVDLSRKFIGCDEDADCVARTIARLNEGIPNAG